MAKPAKHRKRKVRRVEARIPTLVYLQNYAYHVAWFWHIPPVSIYEADVPEYGRAYPDGVILINRSHPVTGKQLGWEDLSDTILHELAHIGSGDYQHGKQFKQLYGAMTIWANREPVSAVKKN